MKNNYLIAKNILLIIPLALLVVVTTNSSFAQSYATNESFEGQGWNAKDARGFTPGLKKSLKPEFAFNQLQGNHSFVIEKNIVRNGKFSAKMDWKHTNPAQYNGNVTKVDNVDRKAMFHGFKTKKVKGAHAWYGFSVYFPKDGTQEEDNSWLFFQIHSSQDHQYPTEKGRNPPFSIRLDKDGFTGKWKWDPEKISDGKKTQGENPFVVPVKKADYLDRWVDFVLHVRFDYSNDKDGIVELWIDGKKVIEEKKTRIGYNDDKGLYPSWGMYWNGNLDVMKHDHYLYLDELRNINGTATYNDVAPRGSKPNENVAPTVNITSPANNATFEVGERITLSADANDPDGTINNVNFNVNDAFYNYDGKAPYTAGFTPTAPGTYKISAVARDNEELETEVFVTITVTKKNKAPTVNITSPANNATFEVGERITLSADANDSDGTINNVNFRINDDFYNYDGKAPFTAGFTPTAPGTYKISAVARDNDEVETEVFITITVTKKNEAPSVNITSPANNATFEVGERITLSADASDPDGTINNVNFRINDEFYNYDGKAPYTAGFTPTAPGTYKISAVARDNEELETEVFVTITVTEKNIAPTASFTTPTNNILEEGYSELIVTVDASDPNGDELTVVLKIDDKEVRSESVAPYEWGHTGSPNPSETVGLVVGSHELEAIVTDSKGLSTTISKTIRVDKVTGTSPTVDSNELTVFPNPSALGVFQMSTMKTFQVLNTTGSLIKEGTGDIIDISNQPKGVYFLKTDEEVIPIVH